MELNVFLFAVAYICGWVMCRLFGRDAAPAPTQQIEKFHADVDAEIAWQKSQDESFGDAETIRLEHVAEWKRGKLPARKPALLPPRVSSEVPTLPMPPVTPAVNASVPYVPEQFMISGIPHTTDHTGKVVPLRNRWDMPPVTPVLPEQFPLTPERKGHA